MTHRPADPKKLARDLLGRDYDDLEADEQRVLKHVAAGSFTGRDADELAQAHATWGDRLADRVAAVGGSWGFIVGFGVVLVVWAGLNSGVLQALGMKPFDAYPFIFLTLLLSVQASYAAPLILLAQNRQTDRDRVQYQEDRQRNERMLANSDYLAREVASLRTSLGELATRDYVRSELRESLDAIMARLDQLKVDRRDLDSDVVGSPNSDEGRRTPTPDPDADPDTSPPG